MKDLRGTLVKVTTNINSDTFDWFLSMWLILDVSCPGIQKRCNDNGQCDLSNGACTCDEDYQGLDCSGNHLISLKVHICVLSYLI